MKIEKIHLSEKTRPVTIDQKQKLKNWGSIATVCLSKSVDTDMKFFECLTNESEKHLN